MDKKNIKKSKKSFKKIRSFDLYVIFVFAFQFYILNDLLKQIEMFITRFFDIKSFLVPTVTLLYSITLFLMFSNFVMLINAYLAKEENKKYEVKNALLRLSFVFLLIVVTYIINIYLGKNLLNFIR